MRRSIRVVTLNIWNRSGPYEERTRLIIDELRALGADVIGLQEVVRVPDGDKLDQLAIFARELGFHGYYGRTPIDQGFPFGNAVLSRWPFSSTHVFALPRCETQEFRNVTYAEIDSPYGRIPFFTTHLNWKLHEGNVRVKQVRELTHRVKELAPVDGFPAIVCGDFNAEPEADESRFMRGLATIEGESVYFADCFGLAGQGDGATFCRRNPYAAAAREPDRRIDYIYVRGPESTGRGEPIEARVCFDAPTGGVWPSDHLGVTARIAVEG